jgi:hypothetical protein
VRIINLITTPVLLLTPGMACGTGHSLNLPVSPGIFEQQIHRPYTIEDGLPDNDVKQITLNTDGDPVARTAAGPAAFDGAVWKPAPGIADAVPPPAVLSPEMLHALRRETEGDPEIRTVARHGGEFAVAADRGLFIGDGRNWRMALPREGAARWAPVDVRAALYDAAGRLWFAAPQGAGYRTGGEDWRLFTGANGLPYNDFTCMAAGPDSVWFGTANGAIQYRNGEWRYRQGRRWLLDNHVRDIAVDSAGNAWLATPAGVSCIASLPMTLAEKAAFFEEAIEKYHRRTRLGYVAPAQLSEPGGKHTATPVFTDNDGHFTGLYLGAVSLGYAATGKEKFRQDAASAFRALAFLSEVTQGGTHPAPEGFIARSIMPVSGPDPNPGFDIEYDRRRQERDSLWKIIQPRWPVDETGEWYWKNDSSSDELDGHFFGYALYFDRVCNTGTEKDEVRKVVRRIIDHILDHGFCLVDHDGRPTRWARFSPDDMNRNEAWCDERGLNSYSILTYLAIAHHITGDPEYRRIYRELALDHGYGMNGMTQPKCISGPGFKGHQPDDNMAFMNYYHLIRYETDPKLLSMFYHAIWSHWQHEKIERNPFFNFIYAACCLGKSRRDQWGVTDLSPPVHCFMDAVDTLRRFPLDLVEWPMSNACRTDLLPFRDAAGRPAGTGARIDGHPFPVDERHELYWDMNPWALTSENSGLRLREGTPYLLAYHMGRAHGFIGTP